MAIFAHLQRLFSTRPDEQQAAIIYVQLVEQARLPEFYTQLGVPDTLDGRFEMISLHLFLVLEAMKSHFTELPHWKPLSGLVIESFFADMDRSLREMGVGDTGIKRRIKAMASAFYGRVDAYYTAIESPEQWHEVLKRNVYATRDDEPNEAQLSTLTTYIQASHKALKDNIKEKVDGSFNLPFASI